MNTLVIPVGNFSNSQNPPTESGSSLLHLSKSEDYYVQTSQEKCSTKAFFNGCFDCPACELARATGISSQHARCCRCPVGALLRHGARQWQAWRFGVYHDRGT